MTSQAKPQEPEPHLQGRCLRHNPATVGFSRLPKEADNNVGAELKSYRITASNPAAAHS